MREQFREGRRRLACSGCPSKTSSARSAYTWRAWLAVTGFDAARDILAITVNR